MDKAPDAFRTISEVADDLDLPQHVLRFWETRFAQIKPMKRGGGRRYYRPDDVELLKGIRHLLYGEGYTIRGVQRLIKDHGVKTIIEYGRGSGQILAEKPSGPDIINPDEPRPAVKPSPRNMNGFETGQPMPDLSAMDEQAESTVQRLKAGLLGLVPAFRALEPQAEVAAPAPPRPGAATLPPRWPDMPTPTYPMEPPLAAFQPPPAPEAQPMSYPRRIHNPPQPVRSDAVSQYQPSLPIMPPPQPAPVPAAPQPHGLGSDDIRRLQTAMLDLMDARKLLDDALKR